MKLQDYSSKYHIPGVQIITPRTFRDCGGEFREILRTGNLDFQIEQINHSIVEPGTIKAFHLHKEQTDIWYVMEKGIVNLLDTRPGNYGFPYDTITETFENHQRLILENQVVVIPPGVLHGIANPYSSRLHMVYMVDRVFNPEDEWRMPWNMIGEKIWQIQNG